MKRLNNCKYPRFAKALNDIRAEKRLTQTAIARTLGVSCYAVSKYCAGATAPTREKSVALARFLNKPDNFFDSLITDDINDRKPTDDINDIKPTDDINGIKPTSTKLGKALIVRRRLERLTQTQVAQALGCSQGAINNYESGRRKPGIDTLIALARLYGEPDYFFLDAARKDSDETDAPAPTETEGLDAGEQLPVHLVETLRSLSIDELVKVLEIVTQCLNIATTR